MALLMVTCFVDYDKALEKLKEKSGKDYYVSEDGDCICHLVEEGFVAVLKRRFNDFGKLVLVFPKPLAGEAIEVLRELGASGFELGIVDNQED